MDQKSLKEKYMDIISKEVWSDKKMQDYCRKKAAYIVELENGDLAEIEKPSIETNFCFGHGYCGVSTEEEEKTAYRNEHYARTNENYFLEQNLKGLDEYINLLKDNDNHVYKRVHYTTSPDNSKLKSFIYSDRWNTPENTPERFFGCRNIEELTKQERQSLLTGYEEVRKAFEKRLHTYLKRYGLSKLNTWTYLVD